MTTKKIITSKDNTHMHLANIMKLAASFITDNNHIEIGAQRFATSVLSEGASAGQALSGIAEQDDDVEDIINTYAERCSEHETAAEDALYSIQPEDMAMIEAVMKLTSSNGTLVDLIRSYALSDTKIDDDTVKDIIGDMIRSLCIVCYKLNIPFMDALKSNYSKLLRD